MKSPRRTYRDEFKIELPTPPSFSAEEYLRNLLLKKPRWIRGLYKIRNFIFRPFGITDDTCDPARIEAALHASSQKDKAPLTINSLDREQIDLRMRNTHIDFILSINVREGITLNSIYFPHDRSGQFYYYFIKPFHSLFVPVMMHKALKRTLMEV